MLLFCKSTHTHSHSNRPSMPQERNSKKVKAKDDEISTLKSKKSALALKLKNTRLSLTAANKAVSENKSTTEIAVSAAIRRTKQSERSHFVAMCIVITWQGESPRRATRRTTAR